MKEFRLLETEELDGITNMAIDEAILEVYKSDKIPVLRIYGWNPFAISIGRFQKIEDLFISKTNISCYTIVRRITGGGAILHHNEITYSIVCSSDDIGIDRIEVKKGFRLLTDFLIKTYKDFNLNAKYAFTEYDSIRIKTKLCFAGKEEYDIIIDRKKIGGNAQKRDKNIIFQHGSIPLRLNFELYENIFNKEFIPSKYNITSLSDYLEEFNFNIFKERLKINFEKSLNIKLRKDTLNSKEIEKKDFLIKTKYSKEEWNLYGKETRMA